MCKWIITIITACLISASIAEAQYYDQSQYSAQTQNSNQKKSQWVEDQWKFNGDEWTRIKGHYENPPKPNMTWQAGHYNSNGYKRQWVQGGWKEHTQEVAEQNSRNNPNRQG